MFAAPMTTRARRVRGHRGASQWADVHDDCAAIDSRRLTGSSDCDMAILHHFPSALVSNWQSAVAKVASRARLDPAIPIAAAHLAAVPVDFNDTMIAAANAVGQAVFDDQRSKIAVPLAQAAVAAGAAGVTDRAKQCAAAAYELAKAKIEGDADAAEKASEMLVQFGDCDPRWGECIAEFVAHYTLTRHADVPYRRWKSPDDFVLSDLPARCRIGIIGDWGTGAANAANLLVELEKLKPDLVIHLGDIYYSCTASEAERFYDLCTSVLPKNCRLFTLCGNHDMYAGGAPYYALLSRIGQPASFFCLRNDAWQILAADTGFNDFDPEHVDDAATWVQDFDDPDDPYSELVWHNHKFRTAGGRRSVLLSHHQPFTRNAPIAGAAVNPRLMHQFAPWFPQIVLWLWGHEHNQVIYAPFQGLEKGRCVGASAIPNHFPPDLYAVAKPLQALSPEQVPNILDVRPAPNLAFDQKSGLYNFGFAMLTLDGQDGRCEYFAFDNSARTVASLYQEPL